MRGSIWILALLTTMVAVGCQRQNQAVTDDQWQAQIEAYDRQTEQMDEILKRQERELDRVEADNERFSKVLTKWEQQAQRMDAVLDAFEEKTGVKK